MITRRVIPIEWEYSFSRSCLERIGTLPEYSFDIQSHMDKMRQENQDDDDDDHKDDDENDDEKTTSAERESSREEYSAE